MPSPRIRLYGFENMYCAVLNILHYIYIILAPNHRIATRGLTLFVTRQISMSEKSKLTLQNLQKYLVSNLRRFAGEETQ